MDPVNEILTYLRTHFFGKYRGLVRDNADTTGRGRLLVEVPAVLGSNTIWAMPCVPYAGADRGFHMLPEADTGVWVEFEGGDPSFPVWCGFFWADGEVPDGADATQKIIKTESHSLLLNDTDDQIRLANSSDASLDMSSEILLEASGSVTIADEVTTSASEASVTVGSSGVSLSKGTGSVAVSDSGVNVNEGAWEVS